jgi:hypothetical protein
MYRIKRIVVVVLLLLVVGLGTTRVSADDGPTEIPATVQQGPTITPGNDGPTETPAMIDSIIIYLVSTLIP